MSSAVCAATSAVLKAKPTGFHLGVMEPVLKMPGDPRMFQSAAKLGLEGVELLCGKPSAERVLALSDSGLWQSFLAEARATGLRVAGVVLNMLHTNPLKNDPLALEWIRQGIPIAKALDARVLLLPFFNKGALQGREEIHHAGDVLKEFAAEAGRQGIVLGLEDTLSAEDNARLLERIGSAHAKVYYDVGNSTHIGGFDPVKEIRWLGRERICQVHLKDKGYLGDGPIDFAAILRTLSDIGYDGFANFETNSPSGDATADLSRNAQYIRKLMKEIV